MIELRNLTASYGGVTAVKDVSLTIQSGTFVVLTGANGSGKTTLVRQFNGLQEPDSGTVTVDGRDPASEPIAVRTSVGMVFQNPRDQFVAATVGADVAFGPENLGLDRAAIDDRVERALAAVNLVGRETDRIDSLSGGEQARVAIAGALAMEPDYLVLDEPLTGLDQPARASVLSHLDALYDGGTAIVLVTHDLRDLLDRADRLVAMQNGRVVVDAPPAAALTELERLDVRVPAC